MKPYITFRRMLVHPKDKRDPLQTADSVYEIPCKSCSKTYIGETGRIFKTRLSEHQKEAEKQSAKNFTRSQRKTSSETFKSAITEHVATNNHIINWDAARIIDQALTKPHAGWKKTFGSEAGAKTLWIRTRGHTNWTESMTRSSINGNRQSWWRHHSHWRLPVTNSSTQSSEQGSWQELKYFEWVLHLNFLDLKMRTFLFYCHSGKSPVFGNNIV